MDAGDRIVRRAYALVEADIAPYDAIDDLLAVAEGDRRALEAALALIGDPEEVDGSPSDALASVGFDVDLADVAVRRRNAMRDLLFRAVASFS